MWCRMRSLVGNSEWFVEFVEGLDRTRGATLRYAMR